MDARKMIVQLQESVKKLITEKEELTGKYHSLEGGNIELMYNVFEII